MNSLNVDRNHVAGARISRSGSTAVSCGVRAVLFAALGSAGGVAHAQDAGAQQIEEVVVTATRREVSFQEVPLAISALTAQRLQDTGVTEFAQIATQLPSLEVEPNTNPFNTSLRIRGMGNLANIPNFEPAVGLFVDGAYRSRSGVAMGDLLDVGRIEVLRGPQSVLYPKNVTAGLINVITNRPTDEFEGWGSASFGNYEYWQLQGGINGALADGVRGRLAFVTSDREGSMEDIVTGINSGGGERTALRGQMEFDLTDRATLRLVAGYSDKRGDCCAPDVLLGNTSRTFMNALRRPYDTNALNRKTAYSDPYRFEGEQYDMLAEFTHKFDSAVLTSTTSYDTFDVDSQFDAEQTALTAAVFLDRQSSNAFGQEFRLTSSGDGPFSWMTGAYFFDNDFVRGSLSPNKPMLVLGPDIVPLPLPGAAGDQSSFESQNGTTHWSLFAQGEWKFTDWARVSAGLRYIDEEQSLDTRSVLQVAALPSLAITTTVPRPVTGERSTDGLAWNISLLFDIADDATVYATVAEGFKGGGFNGDWDATGALTADKREFDDETALNYEAGLKSRFWNDQAALNLSIFRTEFEDFQNASFLGVNFLVRNAEKVITQGIELDGSVRPVTGLTLDYAVTYLDAEYDEFTQGACYFGRTPTNAAERTCDLSGETLPNAPEWRTNLGLQYEMPIASGNGFFRADWSYTAEQNVDTALDPRTLQEAYDLWSARLGWRNERYGITVWGENLTDETVKTTAGPQTIFGGIDGGLQIWLNEPRTYGVTMDVRF